jgi:hypothetical protein
LLAEQSDLVHLRAAALNCRSAQALGYCSVCEKQLAANGDSFPLFERKLKITVILVYQLLCDVKNLHHGCRHDLSHKGRSAVLRDVAKSLDGQTGRTPVVYIFLEAKNIMTCHRDC